MRSAFDDLDYCYFSTIILIVTFQLNTPFVCRTPKGGYSGRLVSKFYPRWLTVDTHQISGVETSAQLLRRLKCFQTRDGYFSKR